MKADGGVWVLSTKKSPLLFISIFPGLETYLGLTKNFESLLQANSYVSPAKFL